MHGYLGAAVVRLNRTTLACCKTQDEEQVNLFRTTTYFSGRHNYEKLCIALASIDQRDGFLRTLEPGDQRYTYP